MTTPKLPPLHWVGAMRIDNASFQSLATEQSIEARERILVAEIERLRAEVEAMRADAERYRWLAAKASKDTAYDRYGNGAHWIIGFFAANGRHALDAAIDAAREAKP